MIADPPRAAVVDLGSNSVRLVVFEGRGRNPSAIFNEKAVLRLGRGLHQTGRLNEDGLDQALTVLRRYHALARAMGAEPFDILATAAVRDAANGPSFVAQVEHSLPGVKVRVLTGEQEARLSADGLLCGIPQADGIMADIGGGSMEVVHLQGGKMKAARTLKLGVLRLNDRSGGDIVRARAIAEEALDRCPSWTRQPAAICTWSAAPGAPWRVYTWSRPAIRWPLCTTIPWTAMKRATWLV